MGKYFYRVLLRVRPHPTLSLRTGGGDGGRRSFLCFARNGKAKPLPPISPLFSRIHPRLCVVCARVCVPACSCATRVRTCARAPARVRVRAPLPARDTNSGACVRTSRAILFPRVCANTKPRARVRDNQNRACARVIIYRAR